VIEAGKRFALRAVRRAPQRRKLTAGRAALALGAGVGVSFAGAATIDSLDLSKRRGRYELIADAQLAATPESIYAVLTDYEDNAFQRISSVYKESDYLEPAPDGTPIVYTLMEGCLLRFCLRMKRVEKLETREPNYIKSYTLPERSNFKYSTSEWVLEPHEGGTKMTYRLEMEPDFFVPPVIGPWYLKRTLASGGVRAVNRIERLALELDAADAAAVATRTAAASIEPAAERAPADRAAALR
jgi:hypothetical protein